MLVIELGWSYELRALFRGLQPEFFRAGLAEKSAVVSPSESLNLRSQR